MPKITLMLGGKVLRVFTINKDVISIGRHPKADVIIDNKAVSRRHAKISFQEGAWVLEDLGSVNGCYVRGQRTGFHILSDGDEIGISKFTLKFNVGEPLRKKRQPGELYRFDEQDYLHHDSAGMPQDSPQPDLSEKTVYVGRPTVAVQRQTEQRIYVGPHIRMTDEKGNVKKYPLNKDLIYFGKGEGIDIPLRGLLLTREVAMIHHRKDGFYIKSLFFWPSLKVNGIKMKEAKLKPGLVLQIGKNRFYFRESG